MTLVLILVIVLLIVLYQTSKISQQRSLDEIKEAVNRLADETRALKKQLQGPKPVQEQPVKPVEPVQPAPVPKPPEPEPQFHPLYTREEVRPAPQPQPMPRYEPQYISHENWFTKWKKNNPDWEKFVGENLVNKIGIAVLVLGIAFFVKYAIDKDWINEVGRVSIGIACGMILTGLAHYLRNSYRSFSSVLAGGGIAVFYFSIAFAFHQYALLTQTAAFLVMVAITGFAVALSVLYDRIELAVIAAVGGFLTPFLVSTGQGNYIVLFSYLLILNGGLLALAYFKRWFLLNVIALALTSFIFAGWLIITVQKPGTVSFPLALLFATAFYFVFLAMNTIHQVRKKEDFKVFDFSLLIFLNAAYFAAGMVILQQVEGGRFQGFFTLFAGFVNLGLAAYFFKRQGAYRNLLYLLIGLTLTFLSLSVPVQLDGHAITLFWSAEFVLLFWLWQRSRIPLYYFASLLVMGFTAISLLMDWGAVRTDSNSLLGLIYSDTKGLVTNIVAALAFAVFARLVHKEKDALPVMDSIDLRRGATLVSIVLAYMTAVYGVNLYFSHHVDYDIPNTWHRLITLVFLGVFLAWLSREKYKLASSVQLGALTLYLVYHIFSLGLITGMRDEVLEGKQAAVHLFIHALTVGVLIAMVVYSIRSIRLAEYMLVPKSRIAWILSILMVIFFSAEFQHAFVVAAFDGSNIYALEEAYGRAGVTIVWGLCSFTLMWLGMQYKTRILRIISLSLFGIALVKLFFYDLAGISAGGKILAFTLLGVLLLTISFMYQKLKKIIIEDVK